MAVRSSCFFFSNYPSSNWIFLSFKLEVYLELGTSKQLWLKNFFVQLKEKLKLRTKKKKEVKKTTTKMLTEQILFCLLILAFLCVELWLVLRSIYCFIFFLLIFSNTFMPKNLDCFFCCCLFFSSEYCVLIIILTIICAYSFVFERCSTRLLIRSLFCLTLFFISLDKQCAVVAFIACISQKLHLLRHWCFEAFSVSFCLSLQQILPLANKIL